MNDKLKMLLVDDDESVVRALTRLIGRAFQGRIDLTALTDSVAAKGWIEKNSPDLVVTDLEMPMIDGFGILATAKRCNPYSQVIMHTGFFSEESLRLALRMEATDYLHKCGEPKDLLDALEHACRRVVRWTQISPETARIA